jgi:hypothetical protein
VPPGYRRKRPPARPKLDPFTGIIDEILAADDGRPRKQRHTAKRIFERLRDEHGYSGGITIDRDRAAGHKHLALLPKPCPSYEPAEGGIPRGTPSFPQPAVKQ